MGWVFQSPVIDRWGIRRGQRVGGTSCQPQWQYSEGRWGIQESGSSSDSTAKGTGRAGGRRGREGTLHR